MQQRRYPELEGKVALVTGASRGIGRAIAIRLGVERCTVIVNCLKEKGLAEDVAGEIEKAGGRAEVLPFNVAVYEEVEEAVKKVLEKHSAVHFLINNAGITKDALLLRVKGEDWHQVLTVNLTGTYNCTKAVLRQMIKMKYGRIVNITSVVGEMGNSGQVPYSASKGGIIAFTKSLAREISGRGITVNAISPGFIATEMTASLPEEVKAKMLENIPLGRYGSPEEVAGVAAFLLSDDASYITGEVIRVNGGLYM